MKKLLLSVAATAMLATGAMAADLGTTPITYNSAAFDWDGFYLGLGGGVTVDITAPPVIYPILTGEIGYNYVLDNNVVLGGELSGLLYLDGTGDTEIYATARLGTIISDNVMIYGLAGLGTFNFGSTNLYVVGVGAEVAVSDQMGIRGELRFDDALTGGTPYVIADASVLWHF